MSIIFPHIDPIALELGPVVIRWYGLAYLAGFIGGWFYARRFLVGLSAGLRPNKDDIDDFLTWMVLGIILGGRLGYILFYNTSYYAQYPLEILKLWQGGMAFHGGLIGSIVAMVLFSVRRKIPLFQLSDVLAVIAPIGLFFGRIANFINGELFGRVTEQPWGMAFPSAPDNLLRHPSQLYESLFEGLILFAVLAFLYRKEAIRKKAGLVSAVFLILYAIFRFVIEFFREPDSHLGLISMNMSMGQILCIPMFLCGVGIVFYVQRKANSQN